MQQESAPSVLDQVGPNDETFMCDTGRLKYTSSDWTQIKVELEDW